MFLILKKGDLFNIYPQYRGIYRENIGKSYPQFPLIANMIEKINNAKDMRGFIHEYGVAKQIFNDLGVLKDIYEIIDVLIITSSLSLHNIDIKRLLGFDVASIEGAMFSLVYNDLDVGRPTKLFDKYRQAINVNGLISRYDIAINFRDDYQKDPLGETGEFHVLAILEI